MSWERDNYVVGTRYYVVGTRILCRGKEILCRGHEILCRGHEILCRGHEILCRGNEINIFFTCPLSAAVLFICIIQYKTCDPGAGPFLTPVALFEQIW